MSSDVHTLISPALSQVDWVDPEPTLPKEEDARAFLEGKLGMTEAEVSHFLPVLNKAVWLYAEKGRLGYEKNKAAAGGGQTAADKKAKARTQTFRNGRDDKRPAKKSGSSAGGGEEEGPLSGDSSDSGEFRVRGLLERARVQYCVWRSPFLFLILFCFACLLVYFSQTRPRQRHSHPRSPKARLVPRTRRYRPS